MKSLTEIKNTLTLNKGHLFKKYGISQLAIFGSFSREQQTETSDLDLMVDFQKPIGIEFIDLANELVKILSIKVDLVSRKGIKPQYFKFIEEDLLYV
jgi:predicted nucleotidyltransferase